MTAFLEGREGSKPVASVVEALESMPRVGFYLWAAAFLVGLLVGQVVGPV